MGDGGRPRAHAALALGWTLGGCVAAACNPVIQPLSLRPPEAGVRPPDGGVDAAPPGADAGEAGSAQLDAAIPPAGADMGGDLTVILWRAVEGGEYQGTQVPTLQWMRREVTVAQYRVCQGEGLCPDPRSWSASACYWQDPAFDDYPVTCVTWDAARRYCDWLGGRLPTVAEWGWAGSSRGRYSDYPWGSEPVTCERAVIRDAQGEGCGTGLPARGCSRPLGNTEQGICDMVGNVSEWYAERSGFVGGAFVDDAPAFHFQVTINDSTYDNRFVGFRCVRE